MLLAHVLDAAAGHSDELPVSRDLEPSGLRQLLRADGHGVGQTVPSLVPHDGLQLLSLFLVGQVSALLHQGGYEPVVHVLVDDQVAVAGTAGTEVGALGDPGVHGSLSLTLGGVAGVVDDDSRVAGAGAVGRHAGGVCGLDHGTAAGGDDQVAALHQLLGQGDAGLLDALDDVGGSALTHQGLTDDVDALVGGLLRARMGAADDDVTGLDGIDHLAGRGQAGVGGGHQRRDHAHRLGILHDALLRDLLDHAHAPLTQAVPQDQLQLVPLVPLGHLVAQAGLVHRLVSQVRPNLHVDHRSGDRLAQPVHALLVIGGDDLRRSAGLSDHPIQHFDLLRSDFFRHCNDLLFLIICRTSVQLSLLSPLYHFFLSRPILHFNENDRGIL